MSFRGGSRFISMNSLAEPVFEELAERHQRELHVHCYRMLASFDEAQDAVQETFLRAWRGRDSFDGSGQFRAWLYRIATNVCLDLLRSRRGAPKLNSFAEVPWLQPYPDQLLDEIIPAPADEEPEQVAIRRETISLAFLAGSPRRAGVPPARAGGGIDRGGCARLARRRPAPPARHQRARREQRPAAGPVHHAGAPAGEPGRVDGSGTDSGRTRAGSQVHRGA